MAFDRRDSVAEIKQKLAQTKFKDRLIDNEVRDSFLDYAMSVLVSRALPDIRDGLKPVQRRIIFAADGLGMRAGTAYKKSARLVGEVIGKYHPHGDQSVYDAMVRMAQDFSLRHPLIDGHGNFGSVDGDGPAAMRYTESRLSRIATEMTRDIDKETVDFRDNYDGSEVEPTVLPAYFPNMLVNGADGIAVGMATKIPPHNLQEVINALVALIENPAIETAGLMEWMQGPDFPTGAQIIGSNGIANYFATGNGSVTIRSLYQINQFDNGKAQIVVTEIPYAVVKSSIVEKIADLVADKQIEGIADLRDESSRKGIRIVIETKRDAVAEVVMNNLLKQTALQTTFSVNLVGLVNNRPKILVLKEMLQNYLDHHVQVVVRRSRFEHRKAKERAHILEGLHIAVSNIDEVVELIRRADSQEQAQKGLMERFKLSEIQAKAILEMRLGRLTGLERDKIETELNELVKLIGELEEIISQKSKQLEIVKNELVSIREKYSDDRRTEILANASAEIEDESLIPVEEIVITMSSKGYLKRLPIDAYKTQRRGGVGVKGTTLNEDDDVGDIVVTTTHTDILFFTNAGKVYRIRGHKLPVSSRQTKGMPAINFIPVEKGERIMSILPVDNYDEGYLFFTTLAGVVKRTAIKEFESIMSRGKIALGLKEGDNLFSVLKTTGAEEIFVGASNGRVCRFNENQVRSMGRGATGVKGMRLPKNHEIVGVSSTKSGSLLLSVGANGLGKMSEAADFRLTKRGAQGVLAFKSTEKTGNLVATRLVNGNEDLMLMTNDGQTIRLPLPEVRLTGRIASGVKLMNLEAKQKIQSVAVLAPGNEIVQEQQVSADELLKEQAEIERGKLEGAIVAERIEGASKEPTDDSQEDGDGQE